MAGPPPPSRTNAVARWLGLQIASKAVAVALGAPVVTGTVMAVLAYAQRLPLAWGFFAVIGVAALTSVILNQARAFLVSYSVSGKLYCQGGELILARMETGLQGYGLGVFIYNDADIPLEYKVRRVVAQIEGRVVNRDDPKAIHGSVIEASTGRLYGIGVAPVRPVKSKHIHGELEFELLYGRPGKLNHSKRYKFDLMSATDDEGEPLEPRFTSREDDD